MKQNIGVWINHWKAVIVSITDDVEKVYSIASNIKKHGRYSGVKLENQQKHSITHRLEEYYAKVIPFLHDADSILILGPDKAKVELKTRLESEALGARITGIETVNKMTDYQIAMKALNHFLNPAKSIGT